MKLFPRVLASGVAFLFIAASCGGATGEGGAVPAVAASKAPVAPIAAPAPKILVITGDTIRANYKLSPEQLALTYPGIHCTQQSRFPQGGRIVWRMKVIDPSTGKPMDDKAIASFTITFPDGKTDKLAYSGHGGTKEAPTDYLWAVGYTIPLDYPTGAFNVKIEAKSVDGAAGSFEQFKVVPAQLTIVPAETK